MCVCVCVCVCAFMIVCITCTCGCIAAGFMPISSTWFSGNGQVCVEREGGREGGRGRVGVMCV